MCLYSHLYIGRVLCLRVLLAARRTEPVLPTGWRQRWGPERAADGHPHLYMGRVLCRRVLLAARRAEPVLPTGWRQRWGCERAVARRCTSEHCAIGGRFPILLCAGVPRRCAANRNANPLCRGLGWRRGGRASSNNSRDDFILYRVHSLYRTNFQKV